MEEGQAQRKRQKKGYGLIRNFGRKRNLLAILAGGVVFYLLDLINKLTSGIQVISSFDLSIAVMPLIGFALGGWGVLGCIIVNLIQLVILLGGSIPDIRLMYVVLARIVGLTVYCALPSILWYAVELKGDDRVRYPRMDTTAHVVKYYLIMVISVAAYVVILLLISLLVYHKVDMLNYVAMFTQYLDVSLILGLPLLILISMLYNRTVTINERMVLAFLLVGVLASVLCGLLVYLAAKRQNAALFDSVAALNSVDESLWTDADSALLGQYTRFWNWYYIIVAIMLNTLMIVEMLFMWRIENKVIHPILHLADVLDEYTQHEEKALASKTVVAKCEPYLRGYGEVSNLTGTCVEMVGEINRYTDNLQQVTGEKERIKTELDVASKIQQNILPNIFPPFPDRPEIELYASMTPAKEVGGDFYDFYMLDQDHLALAIADVSGKGIPASLFMVITMTLLDDYAQSGRSPKEILSYVNHQLCQNNDSMMFCTVWLGILNLKTGQLVASNAGHEYPAVRRSGGQFELFEDTHSAPLGFRDGLLFQEYEITLRPGDCLFQYTDGVTEATDASETQFGEERMLEAINAQPDASPAEQISHMYDAIHGFVKDAPQFDDITMLCLQYNGSTETDSLNQSILTVPANLESIELLTDFITKQLEAVDCPNDILFSFTLVIEEVCANIANYAYDGKDGTITAAFSFDEEDRLAEIVFSDSGIPFDPTAQPNPNVALPLQKRKVGGLGIYLVKSLMDEVVYDYFGGQNVLTVRKRLISDP